MIKNISRLMLMLMLLPTIGLGSTSAYKENDSLVVKSYEDIAKAVDENWKDSTRTVSLAKAWIQKAKKDHNYKQLARAYRAMFHKSGKHQRLLFADSILSASKSTSDASLIGSAYLTKGVAYYEGMESSKALDQYLIADRYISQIQDTYLIHKTKYLIAKTKYYLGFYHEAIALFRECIEYYKEEDDLAYLNALHGLSLCYYSVGQYDLCTETVNHGITAGREFEYTELEMYFLHAEGVNQYFKRNYQKSIALLSKVLPQIKKKKDYANAAVALFYMGKNNWDLNRQELAVGYFKMVDGSFAIHGYLRPDLREGYEILIDYYKKKGDYKSQVAYYDRLSQADKVLNKNYKYLSGRILKEYNNKEIVQGKRNAEHALQMQKIYYGSVIILLSSALTHFIYRYYSNQKRYRRKFEELMQRNTSPDRIVVAKKSAKELDLLPEVAETIYKNLLKFEKNKKYLEKDMNLVKIAAALHTNQRYATKIIWHYRDKKTIEYITDLKIDYIVDRLKNDSRFRLYTHKALGMEAGFGSTQIFTKSFKARCGMSPTFFVSELQKERNSMES